MSDYAVLQRVNRRSGQTVYFNTKSRRWELYRGHNWRHYAIRDWKKQAPKDLRRSFKEA